MRRKGALNDKKIARLTKPGRYGNGHGLYLQTAREPVRVCCDGAGCSGMS